MKNIYFLGGMPRAGSTVLMNLLGQNPNFYVSPTSGLIELLYSMRNAFSNLDIFKASDQNELKDRFRFAATGMLAGWYHDHQTAIDKSRSWIAHYELLKTVWPSPKIIVPIRDIRDAVSSFERIWRKNPFFYDKADNPNQLPEFQTLQGRLDLWLSPHAPLGLALARILDSFQRGNAKHFLFIKYEDLCAKPINTLKAIYKYLERPYYKKHDPNNIKQITHEYDAIYGPYGNHNIRNKLVPNTKSYTEIIPENISKNILTSFSWFYSTFNYS